MRMRCFGTSQWGPIPSVIPRRSLEWLEKMSFLLRAHAWAIWLGHAAIILGGRNRAQKPRPLLNKEKPTQQGRNICNVSSGSPLRGCSCVCVKNREAPGAGFRFPNLLEKVALINKVQVFPT